MFRFNNPDALLVLLMALGAYATMRADRAGPARGGWSGVGVFIGFGFLTKMLQVLLVVPGVRPGLPAVRGADAAAQARSCTCSRPVPRWSCRPAGGSPSSSSSRPRPAPTSAARRTTRSSSSPSATTASAASPATRSGPSAVAAEPRSVRRHVGRHGLTRMFSAEIGGQISWLLPARAHPAGRGPVGLRAGRRAPTPRRAAYIVWGGWLLVTGLTFSLMAGIFHAYYTVALAPAIGALVGMGAGGVGAPARRRSGRSPWPRRRPRQPSGPSCSCRAPRLVAVAAVRRPGPRHGERPSCSSSSCGCTAGAVPLVLAGALVAGLAGPAAYTLSRPSRTAAHRLHPHRRPLRSGRHGRPGGGFRGGGPRWRLGRRRARRHGARRHRARRHRAGGGARRHGAAAAAAWAGCSTRAPRAPRWSPP